MEKQWQLQPGIKIDDQTAEEIAKIACALKSLSIYAGLVIEKEDCPEELRQLVDEGVAAIGKIFVD